MLNTKVEIIKSYPSITIFAFFIGQSVEVEYAVIYLVVGSSDLYRKFWVLCYTLVEVVSTTPKVFYYFSRNHQTQTLLQAPTLNFQTAYTTTHL